MAKYDGELIFNTQIDKTGFNKGVKEIQSDSKKASDKIEEEFENTDTTVKAKVDDSEIDKTSKKLEELDGETIENKVNVDDSEVEETQRKLEDIDNNGPSVKVNVDDNEVDEAQKKVDGLDGNNPSVKVNVDDSAVDEAIKKIEDLTSKASNIALGVGAGAIGGGIALVSSTAEDSRDLARLETNASEAGVGDLTDDMATLNAITGELDSNVEGVSNLLVAGFKGEKFTKVIDELSGAVIKFPDTVKFEGLAEGLNETLKSGKSIGQFDQLLVQTGIDTEKFNEGLALAIEDGTELNYVLEVLEKTDLSDYTKEFKDSNKELVKNQESTYKLQENLADLGIALSPLVTMLTELANDILPPLTDFVEDNTEAIGGAVGTVVALAGAHKGLLIAKDVTRAVKGLSSVIKPFISASPIASFFGGAGAKAGAGAAAGAAGATGGALGTVASFAGPILIGAAFIGTLAYVSKEIKKAQYDALSDVVDLTDEELKLVEKINETGQSVDDIKTSISKSSGEIKNEYGYYQDLKKELDLIVDKNGKIKDGYEDRATFITTTLSKALGIEIKINGDVVEEYDKVIESIDELLIKQQGEALVRHGEDEYFTLRKEKASAYEEMLKAQEVYLSKYEELAKVENEINAELAKANPNYMKIESLQEKYNSLKEQIYEGDEDNPSIAAAYGKAVETYNNIIAMMGNYSNLSEAIITGDTKRIEEAMMLYENAFITAENGTKKTLEEQVKNTEKALKEMERSYELGTPGITKESVAGARDLAEKSVKELEKFEKDYKATGKGNILSLIAGQREEYPEAYKTNKAFINQMALDIAGDEWTEAGEEALSKFLTPFEMFILHAKISVPLEYGPVPFKPIDTSSYSVTRNTAYREVPKYATGTVVPANFGEYYAILGDNKKEPEVVSPISTLKQAMKEVLNESGFDEDGEIRIVLEVGEKVLYDQVRKVHKKQKKRFGRKYEL